MEDLFLALFIGAITVVAIALAIIMIHMIALGLGYCYSNYPWQLLTFVVLLWMGLSWSIHWQYK